ncbi:phage replisome organizer N-terminal domain-containing protein [Tissierella sp.]|uniref:phage replisome organizer N-terminal domain-containing protein n=1 Tax=Tissierella sp. TaxID=41274 RepID=UPI00285F502B|nr:phage replisome organizer N-terminal domain-containing protein [Tissierella sp.]MDR7856641.1 phage replisome organizer N-terminal domain-containing protein [Tissierella sp.]
MVEVKWIKIVTDIFDDDKVLLIESMPEADGIIVIWFNDYIAEYDPAICIRDPLILMMMPPIIL